MTAKALDRTDLKILDVLQQDARITNQALAERVALSPSACLARVRTLEARGLIRGYRAHVAVDRIRSATVVLAQVTFKQHALDEFTEFDRRILAMPEVVEASRISGAYDYLLRVIVNDVHHWKDIARLVAVIAALVGSIFIPPPAYMSESGEGTLVPFARYAVAIVTALLMVAMVKWSGRARLRYWIVATVVASDVGISPTEFNAEPFKARGGGRGFAHAFPERDVRSLLSELNRALA